jgi:cysteinyl-tRNA synthetase
VLKEYAPEVVRFFILRATTEVRSTTLTLISWMREMRFRALHALRNVPPLRARGGLVVTHGRAFQIGMDDDFNTAEALSVLFDLAAEANRSVGRGLRPAQELGGVLGLLEQDPTAFLQGGAESIGDDSASVNARIEARIAAKKARNFAEADRIRAELLAGGLPLKRRPRGRSGVVPDLLFAKMRPRGGLIDVRGPLNQRRTRPSRPRTVRSTKRDPLWLVGE